MTRKDRQESKDIERVIKTVAPLIEDYGLGNIVMTIAGYASATVATEKEVDPERAAAYAKASNLLTIAAKQIQKLEI